MSWRTKFKIHTTFFLSNETYVHENVVFGLEYKHEVEAGIEKG